MNIKRMVGLPAAMGVPAAALVLLGVVLLAVATPARAIECQPGLSGNDWTCENSETVNESVGAEATGTGTVTVINYATGQVNDAVTHGLQASSVDGDVSVTNSGAVNAGDHGLHASSSVDGDVSVTNSGTVEAGNRGINASSGDGDVSVTNSGTVNAGDRGLRASSGDGDVTVTNSGTVEAGDKGINASSLDGDVTVINSGTVNAGDDGINAGSSGGTVTVINSGTVTNYADGIQAYSSSGSAVTVINSGSVTITSASSTDAAIWGGDSDDLVINSGDLSAPNSGLAISTVGGNDTVIIEGGSVDGLIDGGDDTDSLAFSIVHGAEGFDRVVAALAAADPAGGSITINGQTYTWQNFESLQNLLRMAMIRDGRANAFDFTANAALYCAGGGAQVYRIHEDGQGEWAYDVPEGLAAAALGQAIASGQHVLVIERLGVQLWALAETDAYGVKQFQLMGPEGYVYIFPANTCGLAG